MNNLETETKEVFEKTMEARLSRIGARIDELQEQAELMGSKAKIDFFKWIEDMRDQQIQLKNNLMKMKESSGEIWIDLKTGLENSLRELKDTLDKVGPKIKNFPRFSINPATKWIGIILGGVVTGYFIGRFIHKTRRSG